MSQRQRESINAMIAASPLDLGGELAEQRGLLHGLLTSHPLPADVVVEPLSVGGIPALSVGIDGQFADGTVLWFHGGVFAMGSAEASLALVSDLARRARLRVVTVDYRLAPENPYPAATEDALASYRGLIEAEGGVSRVAVGGESAGGNLAVGAITAARDAGLPLPFAAVLMSPWVDLAVAGDSALTKANVDPALTATALRVRARDYLGVTDPASASVSPIHSDLAGLPPLLVQVGSHEILLDDATRLAAKAAADDVAITLDVTPGVPHVFQAFAGALEEGNAALDRAAAFLRYHLPTA